MFLFYGVYYSTDLNINCRQIVEATKSGHGRQLHIVNPPFLVLSGERRIRK